jgi:hypothetical protein
VSEPVSEYKELFNDGVLRATLVPNDLVCVEWLTNKVGYLSKTVVKDLHHIESLIKQQNLKGWVLGSEVENTNMHKLITKFGGRYFKEADGYMIFIKEVN